MLFNSFPFFLLFLPVALLGYFGISRYSLRGSVVFLMLASLVFYSYWDITFLPLLLASIACNYLLGKAIAERHQRGALPAAKRFLLLGLAFNLGLLMFFKYFDFLLQNVAALTGQQWSALGITLPIGISFFTFTQIAYLVDAYGGKVREYQPANYGLFVTYFPHLIAGPILHHKDMMPQFNQVELHRAHRGRITLGLLLFTVGLCKKVVLADGVARFVAPVFDLHHGQLTMVEAWAGALAYTFQLYFDFSAYSDMAYGLSYMFGIILPINFNSPYQASSIIEFWRRWHITLSTFLRDYLYIPLGGNRRGPWMRHLNLMITMLLGGLWHGANWTFVVWGGLHGAYLIINHGVRTWVGPRNSRLLRGLGVVLTFGAVVLAWVFFRASSLPVALDVLRAMCGGTLTDPAGLLGSDRIMSLRECWAWVGACAAVAFFLPNIYQVLGVGLQPPREAALARPLGGLLLGGLLVGILMLLSISETRGVSEFLYFNF